MCVVPVCEFKDKIEVKSVCDFCVLGERVSGGLYGGQQGQHQAHRIGVMRKGW